jgi:hypothetical protein
MKIKIKTEVDIDDIVKVQIALNHSLNRVRQLMNENPNWRKMYELDHDAIIDAKKILANIVANS